ncbi:hypothetical protein A2U01_0115990, partial [Trifolium medium]|nr:hypothetical protein [Trifolium medium]
MMLTEDGEVEDITPMSFEGSSNGRFEAVQGKLNELLDENGLMFNFRRSMLSLTEHDDK